MDTKRERDLTGNVLKGLSIIMVVMGHSWQITIPYVYTCHLALFFFVSGLHYSESKYSSSPTALLSSNIAKMWPKYFAYMVIFVLARNIFIDTGLYSSEITRLNSGGIFQAVLSAVTFSITERMGGALWFVPMFLIGLALIGAIFYVANKCFSYSKKKKICFMWVAVGAFGLMGLISSYGGVSLPYLYQHALLYIPFSYIGYLASLNNQKFYINIKWYGAITAAVIVWYLIGVRGISNVYMVRNELYILLYYPITILGGYVVIWLARIIIMSQQLTRFVSKIGEYSFDIMALHFLAFKIVDYVYNLMNKRPFTELGGFPTSYKRLGVVYVIAGVAIPIIIVSMGKAAFGSGYKIIRKRLKPSKPVLAAERKY